MSTSGGKLWRRDYRFGGKRKTLCFGAYPAVSLKEARRKRDKARELLANDIDPGARTKAAKEEAEAAAREQALTFAVVAEEWFATRQGPTPPPTSRKSAGSFPCSMSASATSPSASLPQAIFLEPPGRLKPLATR
ncbi:MAG: Arm DNA-binding domain-containing protein [Desulfovibrio sp.]|nr:Arm DNA-binding domain-containing protein [Desulfovibrio sp.]